MKKLAEKPKPSETSKASKTRRTARGRKPSSRKRNSLPAGRGGARLRSSVNTMVGKESEAIARALLDKAGNMTGARILVELTGAQNPPARKEEEAPRALLGRAYRLRA